MTPRQSLVMVELPLALPVIMAGIRTAAVWVIGTATLVDADRPDQPRQLHLRRAADPELGLRAVRLRRRGGARARRRSVAGADGGRLHAARSRVRIGLGVLGIVALGAARSCPHARGAAAYVVGAKNFTEQYVLAALIEQRLQAAGCRRRAREGLGSNVIFDALRVARLTSMSIIPARCGPTSSCSTDVQAARGSACASSRRWLARQHGISCSARSASRMPMRWRCGASGPRRSAFTRSPISRATRRSCRSPATMNSSPGRNGRHSQKPMGSVPRAAADAAGLHVCRVDSGEVDVISAYTSDGRIAKYDLIVLDDPRHAIPPYDAIVLISPRRADDAALRAALQPLIGTIDITLCARPICAPAAVTRTVHRQRWRGGYGRRSTRNKVVGAYLCTSQRGTFPSPCGRGSLNSSVSRPAHHTPDH